MKRVLRWLSPWNLRLGAVILPWLLGAIYMYVLAADRYVSEAVVMVRSNSETPPIISGLSALFPAAGSSTRPDSLMLKTYILSGDMLDIVNKQLDLRKAFSSPKLDFWYRLRSDASREQLMAYVKDRVEIKFEDDSGLLTIRSQAFSAEFAAELNRRLIEQSERFINDTSHRIAQDQMAFALGEQTKAQKELQAAKTAVQEFQRKNGMIDPVAQAAANTGVTVDLQATLTRSEAELKSLLSYLNEAAPQVIGIRQQIAAVRSQLDVERRRGTDGASQLNVLAIDFQTLITRMEFAQDAYKAATAGLETARIESNRKLKTLVLVQTPIAPTLPELPRRPYNLLALFLGLCLVYGIARLAVATIEDHQS